MVVRSLIVLVSVALVGCGAEEKPAAAPDSKPAAAARCDDVELKALSSYLAAVCSAASDGAPVAAPSWLAPVRGRGASISYLSLPVYLRVDGATVANRPSVPVARLAADLGALDADVPKDEEALGRKAKLPPIALFVAADVPVATVVVALQQVLAADRPTRSGWVRVSH